MSAFLDKPQTTFVRRALFQVHLWAGVLAGAYIFVVCATGAALMFRIDMQRALHSDLFTPRAPGPVAEPVAILESVAKAYPDERVSGIDAPTATRATYLAYTSSGDRFRTLLLDPVTARMLGELPERSFVRTLQDLHFDLLGGRTGRVVNGVGAVLLLVMCLTGMVIWWPGRANWRRSLTVDVRRQWLRLNWDLHSAVGFWTVSFIAMWAVTGIYFAFPSAFRSAVNRVSPLTIVRAPQSRPKTGAAGLDWRAVIDQARRHAPGLHVARVVLPFDDRSAFLVMFSRTSPTPPSEELLSVYLDQHTGARLDHAAPEGRSAGDIIMAWVAPLHVGNFGGLGVRLAWMVLGLAPPLMFVTGFIMWWTRVLR